MRAVILALALVFGVAVAGRSDKAAYARGMVEDLDCESRCQGRGGRVSCLGAHHTQ